MENILFPSAHLRNEAESQQLRINSAHFQVIPRGVDVVLGGLVYFLGLGEGFYFHLGKQFWNFRKFFAILEGFDSATDVEDVTDYGLVYCLLSDGSVICNQGYGGTVVSDALDGSQSVGGDNGVYFAVDEH